MVEQIISTSETALNIAPGAVAVDREPEAHFGADLVTVSDRDLAHIVAEADEPCALPVVPGACRAHPRGEPVVHLRVLPVANHDLPAEAQAGVDEPRLAIAVRGLVEVHEVHVDRAPRQVAVELRVEMNEGFAQRGKAADPHFRRREGVHPQHKARAFRVGVGGETDGADFFRRLDDRRENDLERDAPRRIQPGDHRLRVRRDLLQGFGAVEVLAAGDEPDFGRGEEMHGRGRLRLG